MRTGYQSCARAANAASSRALATVETIDHTGDIGIVVRAPTQAELFEAAALAMFDIIVEGRPAPTLEDRIKLAEDAPDRLLREFLSDLLYQFAAEGKVYSAVRIESITPTSIAAIASGAPYSKATHALKTELKAVTYHQLEVVEGPGGWRARIIFDV